MITGIYLLLQVHARSVLSGYYVAHGNHPNDPNRHKTTCKSRVDTHSELHYSNTNTNTYTYTGHSPASVSLQETEIFSQIKKNLNK